MKHYLQVITLIFILTAGLPYSACLQEKKPEAKSFPMFTAAYSLQAPGGDMKTRFGINSTIGSSFIYKHKSNFLFDLNCHYLFGTSLKEEASSILDGIRDSDGNIINEHGEFAKIVLSERGFFAGARLGYVIPVLKDNPNSGIMISGGGGLLQHKIRIENDGNNAPQILNDYKKGYDKLTNGFCLTEFVGFVYFGKQHLVNFYAGFEFYQAYTQSRRSYDFNLMGPDLQKRRDYLTGFKVGWIIPIYKRMPDPFYTN
jgi:hypothetical protein